MMRTHYLKDLQLKGRERALTFEPAFDFHRAKKVLHLEVDFTGEAERLPSLRLELAYEAGSNRYKLGLLLEDIRELVLPQMTPSFFVPELEIEEVRDRQNEGICFEVVSHFEHSFRCACREVTVVSFEPA